MEDTSLRCRQSTAAHVAGLLMITALARCSNDTDVRLPPSITHQRSEKEVIYRPGDSIVLDCVAVGSPAPQYQWLKTGAAVDLDLRNIHAAQHSGSITMDPLVSGDEGYYQCAATNTYGKALSDVVHLREATLRSSWDPLGQSDPYPHRAVLGEAAVIPCQGASSVPAPTYSWSVHQTARDVNPQVVMMDERVNMDADGNLHFANVLAADGRAGGIYTCGVFNPWKGKTEHGSYARLVVQGTRAVTSKPYVAFSSPTDAIILAGKDLVLRCLFAGNPTPTIAWRRQNSSLPIGRHNISNHGTELVISPVELSDEDVYYCQGNNSLGSEELIMAVDVQVPARFADDEASVTDTNSTDGDTVVFRCDVSAEPEANIQWLRNGQPLSAGQDGGYKRMTVDDRGRMLKIRDVCKSCEDGSSDLMVLQCNASTVHGYVFSAGYLNILSPTVILVGPSDVELTAGEDAVFHCEARGDDSTPVTVQWLWNGVPIPHQAGRLEILANNSLHIVTPKEGVEDEALVGQYTCVADNGYTRASASARLAIPGPPLGLLLWQLLLAICSAYAVFLIVALVISPRCAATGQRQAIPSAVAREISATRFAAIYEEISEAFGKYPERRQGPKVTEVTKETNVGGVQKAPPTP